MLYYFTYESVSEGHPYKVAYKISDAFLDNFLAFDAQSKVACETAAYGHMGREPQTLVKVFESPYNV